MINLLVIGDPNSIHDTRWIEYFSSSDAYKVYLLSREEHYHQYKKSNKTYPPRQKLLKPIQAPSTVRIYRTMKNARYIRSLVKMYKIDVIHIMYAEPNALWARWIRMLNTPVVLTTRGTDVLKTIPDFFRRKDLLSRIVAYQYKEAFNIFDYITCTSQKQAQSLKAIGVKSSLQIVRTGVDFGKVSAAASDMKSTLSISKPFVLMPRNMKPIYYHEFTLEAISLLNQKIKQDYTYVFVDADTYDQKYFQKIKDAADNIAADIRFYPSLSHEGVLSLYKQAVLVVMNPISDGSPVSAMEAMACKVPVVLPPLAYDQEVFCYCPTFEVWKPQALKEKMEEVITMKEQELHNILCKSYQLVLERGDTAKEMRKVAKLYRTVLAHSS